MNRDSFYQSIKSGKIMSCYLFEGEEEFTKESALKTLRSAVLKEDVTGLNDTVFIDPSAQALISCAETFPMMADKRFILVKDSSLLSSGRNQDTEEKRSLKTDDGDEVVKYLANLPPTVCVVFYIKGKAAANRKLYKLINKLGGLVTFDPLDQNTLIKWIKQKFKSFGKQINSATAEQIIFAVGTNMHTLSHEVAKLAASASENESISLQDIENISTKSTEYKVFDLADALISGQSFRVDSLMNKMLQEGEQRLMLLSLLQRQFRQLFFIKILLDDNQKTDQISRQLSLSSYVVRKLQPMALKYDVSYLHWAYNLLIDTEFLVKSGQIFEEGSLEQAVYRILSRQIKEKND
ncbi:MAG: DNA polymerase III subunit delta [Clostridiales bacterium]|nr:DNA polymerase III subunit delta [Clostridiales bacterium]